MTIIQDESFFHYETKIKKVLAVRGSKPRAIVTGSKKRLCVIGSLTNAGKQYYRVIERCRSAEFIAYIKGLHKKFGKIILIIDKAPWHTSKVVKQYFEEHKGSIKIEWLPTGCPELNPLEETWRQGKNDDALGAKWHDNYLSFKTNLSTYYRTRRFNLSLSHYLGD